METKLPDLIRFGREICGDLAQAERREWWLANGLGGYASGTIAGTLTRRYHGLLVAPVNPPLDRHVVMAKADATLVSGERSWPLFTNRWSGGAVDPTGYLGDRDVSARRPHSGVALRLRRTARREPDLDGARRKHNVCRLAPCRRLARTR